VSSKLGIQYSGALVMSRDAVAHILLRWALDAPTELLLEIRHPDSLPHPPACIGPALLLERCRWLATFRPIPGDYLPRHEQWRPLRSGVPGPPGKRYGFRTLPATFSFPSSASCESCPSCPLGGSSSNPAIPGLSHLVIGHFGGWA
jgi:hypothetical protein